MGDNEESDVTDNSSALLSSERPAKRRLLDTSRSAAMALSKRITERGAGITSFASNIKGFECTLKHRFTDFIVQEVSKDGLVASLDASQLPSIEDKLDKSSANPTANPTSLSEAVTETQSRLSSICSEAEVERLRDFVLGNDATKDSVAFEPRSEKSERTALHKAIKATLSNFTTDTITDAKGAMNIVRVFRDNMRSQAKRQGGFDRRRKQWPSDRPDYLSLTLLKSNTDAFTAIGQLARSLNVAPRRVGVAGNKDKRAVTMQHVTVYRGNPDQVSTRLNTAKSNVFAGNFRFTNDQIRLGSLRGNKFKIALRGVKEPPEVVNVAAEKLNETGFINYFGLQRFGTSNVGTHEIGVAILKRDWKTAVELILAVKDSDNDAIASAKRIYLDDPERTAASASKAMKALPRFCRLEGAVLGNLSRLPDRAYCDGVRQLPANSKTLYVHALQSFIWNKVASCRAKDHGTQTVLAGDLVLEPDSEHERSRNVRVLTAEEAASCDPLSVVLPLPGVDGSYPENSMREIYRRELQLLGLDIDDMPKLGELTPFMSYRSFAVKPRDFSWHLVEYSHADEDIFVNPIDECKQKVHGDGMGTAKSTPSSDRKPGGTALIVEFELPPSVYATMLFRELTKMESSALTLSKIS